MAAVAAVAMQLACVHGQELRCPDSMFVSLRRHQNPCLIPACMYWYGRRGTSRIYILIFAQINMERWKIWIFLSSETVSEIAAQNLFETGVWSK